MWPLKLTTDLCCRVLVGRWEWRSGCRVLKQGVRPGVVSRETALQSMFPKGWVRQVVAGAGVVQVKGDFNLWTVLNMRNT